MIDIGNENRAAIAGRAGCLEITFPYDVEDAIKGGSAGDGDFPLHQQDSGADESVAAIIEVPLNYGNFRVSIGPHR